MKRKHRTAKFITNSILALIMLMPLYWTFITALKDKNEIYEQPQACFRKESVGGIFRKFS